MKYHIDFTNFSDSKTRDIIRVLAYHFGSSSSNIIRLQQTFIARQINCNVKTVKRKLQGLVKDGYIITEPSYIIINGTKHSTTKITILDRLQQVIQTTNHKQGKTKDSDSVFGASSGNIPEPKQQRGTEQENEEKEQVTKQATNYSNSILADLQNNALRLLARESKTKDSDSVFGASSGNIPEPKRQRGTEQENEKIKS